MKEEKRSSRERNELDIALESLPDETVQRKRKRREKEGQEQKAQKRRPAVKKDRTPERKPKARPEREQDNVPGKPVKKLKRMTNREFARVTYIFVTLFLVLIGYLVYFNVIKSKDIINSPYNFRQDLLAKRVVRGSIVDQNGNVLAETQTADDGTETRVYPYGDLFAHVVGYVDEGTTGIESIENFRMLTSNAFFLEKLMNEFQDQKNMGDTVVTTLDASLQQAAYDAMGNNKGAAVVMEASTGKILAMVSKPTFDPGTVEADWEVLNSDPDSALLNRATLGQYTPGSTFKVVTALEYIRENPDYSSYGFTCDGSITVDGTTIHCYDSQVHGQETLTDSMANSCNSSFANIGLSLDITSWQGTAGDLLFGKDLPCDLSYRSSSFNLEPGAASADIMMTAMGQGTTLVSPYHMALIMSAIANGGKLMKPYLVSEITNYTGTTVKKYMPENYADLMTSSEAAQLQGYLEAVVDYGTGRSLSGESYSVAGKTGTAEVSMDKETVNSWFVGFSNVDNPELVVSVVIENADTTSITGVSVAKQIFNAYYY